MHCFTCQSAIGPDDSWCSKCGAGGASARRSRQRTSVCDHSSCRCHRLHRSCCRTGAGGGCLAPRAGSCGHERPRCASSAASSARSWVTGWLPSSALRSPTTTMRPWPAMRRSSWSGASAVWAIPDFRSGSASTPAMSLPTWSPANFPRSTRSAAPPSIWPRGWRRQPRRTRSTCPKPARSLRTGMSALIFLAARLCAVSTRLCRSIGSLERAIFRAGGCDARVASPGLSTGRRSGRCCGALRRRLSPAGRRFC